MNDRGRQSDGRQGGKRAVLALWACRVCFAFVFAVNIQCAFSYIFMPEAFVGGFQLSGVEGMVAVQGIGVAFLMWNATYPAFIVSPPRFRVLGVVVLCQQVIGLIGESAIYLGLPEFGYAQLAHSIERFIVFDAVGLVLMTASFIALCLITRNRDTNLSW